MKRLKGTLLLLLAALVWGMAFVAQSTAADHIGSFTFNATRSVVGAIFLAVIIMLKKAFSKKDAVKPDKATSKKTILGGCVCGAVLFVAANFQQFGIAAYPADTAASGRAGFITATYVVMVAICSLFFGKKLNVFIILATIICIGGMYMLCLTEGFSGIYLGDILVFAGSVSFVAHIFVIDHYSAFDGIRISCYQFLTCGLLSLIAALIFEKPDMSSVLAAWLPILYAGIFSSGVGYTLQIIGQKYAEPAVASIVMSLESVFAALAGWVILHERLSVNELIGCGLVFFAVILAQLPDFKKSKA